MGKFKSINYSRVVCEDCNAETIIEPGTAFSGLNCKCGEEVAVPYGEITVWTDGQSTIEVLGEFENGDFEVKHEDGTLSYRMPHQTFVDKFDKVENDIPPPAPSLEDLTIEELKELATEQGITFNSRIGKNKLIERLTDGKD